MVAGRRLNVMLYVHCLSYLPYLTSSFPNSFVVVINTRFSTSLHLIFPAYVRRKH